MLRRRDRAFSKYAEGVDEVNGKILIDAGLNRGRPCSGRWTDRGDTPATRIGEKLSGILERMGYEVLYSERVPDLAEYMEGAGRPSVCAAVARRWRADCVIRLCVRAAELPSRGSADGLICRMNSPSWSLADSVLQSVESGTELNSRAPRQAESVLLLRRTPCAGMVLILRLPFRQKEDLTAAEAETYAAAIAEGIDRWAKSR